MKQPLRSARGCTLLPREGNGDLPQKLATRFSDSSSLLPIVCPKTIQLYK